ncbi:hypothetical protein B0H14DRAFT_2591115 [Mycena olivaceomarginata]|nr:hypothetical protein B0H14DRAFT_2591115 [Mycena olivaceomarginata]
MASIRLRALPGASLLVVPTSSGITFHVENSGNTEGSHGAPSKDTPEIVLTSSPEGVRIVVQHTVSGNNPTNPSSNLPSCDEDDPTRVPRLLQAESLNFEVAVQGASESFTNTTMFSQLELDRLYPQMAPVDFFLSSLENFTADSEPNAEDLNMDWFLFSRSPEDIAAGSEHDSDHCNMDRNSDREYIESRGSQEAALSILPALRPLVQVSSPNMKLVPTTLLALASRWFPHLRPQPRVGP